MRKLRILLADDHETVREGLKVILNAQPDMAVVAEASDGQTAVHQASTVNPDLVVMDVSMPRFNGLEATEAIRERCPASKILAFTRHSDDGYVKQLLNAGVSGYVLKQSRTTELLRAIRAIASGGKYLDPTVTEKLLGEVGRQKRIRGSETAKSALSSREEETLKLVAWGHSNKEIADQLVLSVKTVETHKANAMQKLGLRSRTDVVKFALLQGWLREG